MGRQPAHAMDLTQIRYFLALAQTLNFTRAAEACRVTQPALTKSIQRLEEELGGPLLLRERALTQLTPLGRAMLPLLEQCFAAAERAKEHASGMKRPTLPPRSRHGARDHTLRRHAGPPCHACTHGRPFPGTRPPVTADGRKAGNGRASSGPGPPPRSEGVADAASRRSERPA